jgi:hypothetical protein
MRATILFSVLAWAALPAPAAGGPADARSAAGAPSSAAADLRIDFDRGRGFPGELVSARVRLRDARGRPTDAPVILESDFGELRAVDRVERGHYRVSLKLPETLPPRGGILVLARTETGAVRASAVLPVVPGPAASLRLEAPDRIRADGVSRYRIEIAVRDAFGNPAEEPPEAHATHGEVRTALAVERGRWVIEYRPRRIAGDVSDVVTVQAGAIRGTHALRLTGTDAWLGLAPRIGVALGSGGTGLAIGASASAWQRRAAGRLGLRIDGGWWTAGRSSSLDAPGGVVRLSGDRSYLSLTAALAWEQPLWRRTSGSLSLGGGVARVSSTSRLTGQPAVSEAAWAPTATAALAIGVRAWRGSPFLELRTSWIADPDLATVRGSVWPILLQAGYHFDAP